MKNKLKKIYLIIIYTLIRSFIHHFHSNVAILEFKRHLEWTWGCNTSKLYKFLKFFI